MSGPYTEHKLKVHPPHWKDIADGAKRVEIRFDDRGYKPGDVLVLREYVPHRHDGYSADYFGGEYTGNVCRRTISHVLPGGQFGLEHGYVALSLFEETA